jgi:eukaryotic-like serine/threonine-protein kinase
MPTKTTVREPKPTGKRGRTIAIAQYTAEARPLGKGGMATVYRATGPDGEVVAIKELMVHLRSDRKMVRRFRQEYDVVSGLDHPNVVRFLDYIRANDTYNIIMEYVDGVSLRQVLSGAKRLDPALVAALGHQLAEAVHAFHGEGVLHRDIKPGNILLGADGSLKIGDFGIAIQEGTRMTATGMVLGSPAYMSPEQLAGQRDVIDVRTDVYALGVVLYECIEGLDPFRVPRHEDLLAVLHRKRETAPKPLKRCPDADLAALLLQCLAVEPDDRPADMGEVGSRLAVVAERGARTDAAGSPAPGGRALGKALLAAGKPVVKKPARKAATPRVEDAPDPVHTTRTLLRERRTSIWITLALAAALAAAAFLLSDSLGL